MRTCDLRFDTPPEVLADALLERSWTVEDVLHAQQALLVAFLVAGGWDMLPEGIVAADEREWEFIDREG
jgi:hypothetical protein